MSGTLRFPVAGSSSVTSKRRSSPSPTQRVAAGPDDEERLFNSDAPARSPAPGGSSWAAWFLLSLAIVLVLLAWAITMTVLYTTKKQAPNHATVRENICNAVPKDNVIDESNGCVFSSTDVVTAHSAIVQYMGDYHFCLYWIFDEFNWAEFTGGNSWSTWGTTAATNPLIAAFDAVNATIQTAIANPATTFTERAELTRSLGELELLPRLAKLHHYHTGTFDWLWWWSNVAPPVCVYYHADFLPFFSDEPDYTAKSMLFLNNTLNAITLMNEYYPLAIEAEILWFNDSASQTWFNDWIIATTPGLLDPVCAAMPEVADQTACETLVDAIEAAFATLTDVMENQWIPACNAEFGYDVSGRAHLPNGVDASYVWTELFYAVATADEMRDVVARTDAEGEAESQMLLDVVYPGTTIAEWNDRKNNLGDAEVWLCEAELAEIPNRVVIMYHNTSVWIQQAMGYGSFDYPITEFSISSLSFGTWQAGDWNRVQLLWNSPSIIGYGLAFNVTTEEVCFPQYRYSVVSHEGPAGHARQVPLTAFYQCASDPLGWAAGMAFSYSEGIGVYGEGVLQYDTTMVAECPLCGLSNLGYTGYTNIGSMYDFAFYDNLTFTECLAISLASGAHPTASLAYRNCYRSMNSMQRSTYDNGAERIRDLRAIAEDALGGDFDLIHWNKFIFRVGYMKWDTIDHLNNVYIAWRQGDPAAADMDGYDYLVCQLFGNTWVTNFGASHLPILDDLSGSNPSKMSVDPRAAIHAAAETDEHIAEMLQRIAREKTGAFSP